MLRQDFGISFADVGFLIGLYMLPGIVLALPGGMLGQRFGDKRMVCLGLVLMTLGGVILGSPRTMRRSSRAVCFRERAASC